ncbi:hypothetical protein V6N12_011306 [Hibiscus sabdariffa]|uniref:Uncharacterized protein n=1 Tax=Hibiscus sabdariffa TaxID=183260 RepID=A0ABR2B7W5_9ROSI
MNELQKNGRNESTEVDGRVASESMDVEADVLVLDRLEGALGAIHEMPGVQESSTSNARASYADMVSDPSHNVSKAINQDELTPDSVANTYNIFLQGNKRKNVVASGSSGSRFVILKSKVMEEDHKGDMANAALEIPRVSESSIREVEMNSQNNIVQSQVVVVDHHPSKSPSEHQAVSLMEHGHGRVLSKWVGNVTTQLNTIENQQLTLSNSSSRVTVNHGGVLEVFTNVQNHTEQGMSIVEWGGIDATGSGALGQ